MNALKPPSGLYELARSEADRAFSAASIAYYAEQLLNQLETEDAQLSLETRITAVHLRAVIKEWHLARKSESVRP